MRRLAPTFFLRGCSHTRLLPRTSACLWTASRERKLRRREGARRDPDGSGILTRYNRPTAGRVAHLAGRKCNHRDQRRADCKRGWRLALHGVGVGGAAARIGRESKEPSRRRILPGASPRYPDSRHAEATAEGQSFRETHISFFQDGFDESSSAGIGTCRRAGRRGRPGGRANRGTRPGGTRVAFPTRGGHLRDFASSAKTGAGTGSAADHDGGAVAHSAVQALTGLDVDLKWPNDLLIQGKKVGGILTEMHAEPSQVRFVIVGIGLNVNQEKFPAELSAIGTSLRVQTGRAQSRMELLV